MRLFNNNIVPYASTEGDKIYPIVVDIKKGIKSGEAISFVTADNQVGVITVDFMDGNSSYSIEDCMVTSTIRRPDGTVLEIPCDIISQSTIEIPLGINGTYQEGVHTFDLKIVRGNGKVIGVPTMSYSVSGSLSSDDVVESDDRLPVLTMVLDNAQDKLTRLDRAIAGATNDLEVKEARDGEVTLNARLERDLEKGKLHFVNIEGSNISTESEEGYLENVEIHGNTWQNAENLADIRSVGTKVEGQELYEIPVLSCGKNICKDRFLQDMKHGSGRYIEINGGYPYSNSIVYLNKGSYVLSIEDTDINVLNSDSNIVVWKKDKIFSNCRRVSITSGFTINDDEVGITFYASTKDGSNINNYVGRKISISEGTQATPYEPYQEDKLTILSPVPLEKVEDVADRIVCKDGVWGVEKNIDEVYISDKLITREPTSKGSVGLKLTYVTYKELGLNGYSYVIPLSNKFKSLTGDEYVAGSTVGIYGTGGNFDFVLPTSCDTLEKAKNLINGTIVKYATNEPQFIPLPHDQQVKLRTFANRTNISFLTETEGTIKAQVPKSLGATVNTHTTQIDNLNKELDRVKKLEESTVSTVTSDKAFTTIAETTGGYFEDVKIEGKTLVNLAKVEKPLVFGINSEYRMYSIPCIRPIQLGKTYTLFAKCTEYSLNTVGGVKFGNWGLSGGTVNDATIFKGVGDLAYKFTVKENATTTLVQLFIDNDNTEGSATLTDFMILEGDHTDKDITFFEGLKSVGQDTDISISSVNENLLMPFHTGSPIGFSNLNAISFSSDHSISYKATAWGQGVKVHVSGVSKGEKYLLLFDSNLNGVIRGYGGLETGRDISCHDNKIEITAVSSGDAHIVFKNTSEVCDVSYTNARLVKKSSIDTNYKLHKQDKKQLLYYNPTTQTWEKPVLREWDSIEKHSDGKYYYHKRSEEVVLNGSEDWFKGTIKQTTQVFSCKFSQASFTNPINDKFPMDVDGDVEKIAIADNNTGVAHMYYAINKSKLSTQDATGFKQWLQANPTTVVYKLAKEEVYECTNLDLITYPNETNLIVNSGVIQPKITLKLLSNVSNVIKLLQEKVSVLENKFIEGLKQVLSGNMMALAHLLYPEDFENNHEIQTLEL